MSEKYEKSRFVGVRRTKISENQLSSTGENQKSAKISFPPRGKIRNQRKSAIFHEGKSEITKNRLSSTGENQKTAKSSCPPRGKTRHRRKPAFPREGKLKNAVGYISHSSERRKPRKFDEITFGGQFTFYILSFSIYRPDNCYFPFFFSLEMTLYSEGDMP